MLKYICKDLSCSVQLIQTCPGTSVLYMRKLISRAGTSNYIPLYLRDVIICPCLWYLILAHKFSYCHDEWLWSHLSSHKTTQIYSATCTHHAVNFLLHPLSCFSNSITSEQGPTRVLDTHTTPRSPFQNKDVTLSGNDTAMSQPYISRLKVSILTTMFILKESPGMVALARKATDTQTWQVTLDHWKSMGLPEISRVTWQVWTHTIFQSNIDHYAIYHRKYAHGFVALRFVLVPSSLMRAYKLPHG